MRQWLSTSWSQPPQKALNYSLGTFCTRELNKYRTTDKEMSHWCQVNSGLFSEHWFPHGTSWEWVSLLCQIENARNCRIQKRKKCLFSQGGSWRVLHLDRNVNRKAVSQPGPWLSLFSNNDAGGILNRAFKPGKSIKLSVVAKSWESAVHVSPV